MKFLAGGVSVSGSDGREVRLTQRQKSRRRPGLTGGGRPPADGTRAQVALFVLLIAATTLGAFLASRAIRRSPLSVAAPVRTAAVVRTRLAVALALAAGAAVVLVDRRRSAVHAPVPPIRIGCLPAVSDPDSAGRLIAAVPVEPPAREETAGAVNCGPPPPVLQQCDHMTFPCAGRPAPPPGPAESTATAFPLDTLCPLLERAVTWARWCPHVLQRHVVHDLKSSAGGHLNDGLAMVAVDRPARPSHVPEATA
ncbi:hypothetical protein [Streptomyces sp. NPDC046978]|uniref:hypothetical protein n=1 Tax=Streptomyces sp. NPDC046978 TaxID=3154704 RepID=UPI0033F13671